MAAFDAVATATAIAGTSSPLNFNLTVVSAVNGYIVVNVAVGKGLSTTITGVTIGGAAATFLGRVESNNGVTGGDAVYGLKNAATGAVAISIAYTGTTIDIEAAALSATAVHQTTSVGAVVTNFGHSATPSVGVTDSVSGDLVVDGMVNGSGASSTSSQTERWDTVLNGGSAGGTAAGATAPGASGTVTMSHTITLDDWGIVAFALKDATAPANLSALVGEPIVGVAVF